MVWLSVNLFWVQNILHRSAKADLNKTCSTKLFPHLLLQGNLKHASPAPLTGSPSPLIIPVTTLLRPPGPLIYLILPIGKRALPSSKSFLLLPLLAQVPSVKTQLTTLILISHKALLFLTAFLFPWPGFCSHAFLILSLLLLSAPYFAPFTSPRLSEPFLETCLEGFHSSIPPAAPMIYASCL